MEQLKVAMTRDIRCHSARSSEIHGGDHGAIVRPGILARNDVDDIPPHQVEGGDELLFHLSLPFVFQIIRNHDQGEANQLMKLHARGV